MGTPLPDTVPSGSSSLQGLCPLCADQGLARVPSGITQGGAPLKLTITKYRLLEWHTQCRKQTTTRMAPSAHAQTRPELSSHWHLSLLLPLLHSAAPLLAAAAAAALTTRVMQGIKPAAQPVCRALLHQLSPKCVSNCSTHTYVCCLGATSFARPYGLNLNHNTRTNLDSPYCMLCWCEAMQS